MHDITISKSQGDQLTCIIVQYIFSSYYPMICLNKTTNSSLTNTLIKTVIKGEGMMNTRELRTCSTLLYRT